MAKKKTAVKKVAEKITIEATEPSTMFAYNGSGYVVVG